MKVLKYDMGHFTIKDIIKFVIKSININIVNNFGIYGSSLLNIGCIKYKISNDNNPHTNDISKLMYGPILYFKKL